jgi:hypothetical protein
MAFSLGENIMYVLLRKTQFFLLEHVHKGTIKQYVLNKFFYVLMSDVGPEGRQFCCVEESA